MILTNKLISDIRKATRNTDENSISDSEFLVALNDAQERCQSILTSVHPDLFLEEEIIEVVAGQEFYNITGKVYLNTRIKTVEYSQTGNARDYYELDLRTYKERKSFDGTPNFYIRAENGFYLNPIPISTGYVRVIYEKTVTKLDMFRGLITAVATPPTITSITLSTNATAYVQIHEDLELLNPTDFVCVQTAKGVVTARNIPVSGFSNPVIVVPSHPLAAGETIIDTSLVLIGKDVTAFSELPDSCERYLRTYAEWKIFNRDNSDQDRAKQNELVAIETDLKAAYAQPSRDVRYVPILDSEIL